MASRAELSRSSAGQRRGRREPVPSLSAGVPGGAGERRGAVGRGGGGGGPVPLLGGGRREGAGARHDSPRPSTVYARGRKASTPRRSSIRPGNRRAPPAAVPIPHPRTSRVNRT